MTFDTVLRRQLTSNKEPQTHLVQSGYAQVGPLGARMVLPESHPRKRGHRGGGSRKLGFHSAAAAGSLTSHGFQCLHGGCHLHPFRTSRSMVMAFGHHRTLRWEPGLLRYCQTDVGEGFWGGSNTCSPLCYHLLPLNMGTLVATESEDIRTVQGP